MARSSRSCGASIRPIRTGPTRSVLFASGLGPTRSVARLLLDTTVLIDIERGGSANGLVTTEDEIATAAICIAELLVGAERAEAKRRQRREEFIASLVESIPIELYD